MKYMELFGDSIKSDIDLIQNAIDEDDSIVFVYSGTGTLYDYITALNAKNSGLNSDYLYKFKVCYENRGLRVSYSRGNKRSREIISMSSLINELDGKSNCRIVVENDDRVQLAFIVQQLIYLEYPLEKVDILLRKEERDADKTKRFMKHVNELLNGCDKSIKRLQELLYQVECESDENNPTKSERYKDINDALNSCYVIRKQIEKSIDVELKFAVAASKKAGKSVIVNCFLGEQVAPTSTELATPNNCFYKKSPDNMYHLQLEGGPVQNFSTCTEIYDVINENFRAAQNNKDDGFSLPDMNIGYVTEENNFSSYTIFDTAGPDAAGTSHGVVAKEAMQKCDVAVFAIDYSKYLTTSEEQYLKEVKSMFMAQNKFHSLIFALNKIDVRYTDVDSPKSFIMSVDFLKTRLANIDEAYKDCIIFPTCSLEYFSAIEAEKAGVSELNAENNLPIGEMKRVKFAHKDVPALAWLHTHSENLEYYHGIQTISYDVFKKDSGMPALMSYVSYVAQSKARDEIVNNVTFEIANQKVKIQGVLDFIANIEALINADDEKIGEISSIITDYSDSVQEIVSPEFRREELAILPDNSIFKSSGGNFDDIIKHQRKAVESCYKKESVAEAMYTATVDEIWHRISKYDEIDGNQIDKLFTTADFKAVANAVAKSRVDKAANMTYDQLCKLGKEVKSVIDFRQKRLREESNNCRDRLVKEHINIELPDLPEFEFATKVTSPGNIIVDVGTVDFKLYDKLSFLFDKKFFKNIGVWFSKLFGGASEKDYKRTLSANKNQFLKACQDKLEKEFKYEVLNNEIHIELGNSLNKTVVEQYMNGLVEEMKQGLRNMNDTYMSCIERFRAAVDDRDKYKAEIELYNLRKSNIMEIGDCTDDFMSIWNIIIRDFEEDTSESEKILVTV